MQLFQYEQGTDDWLEWRNNGIGSSDVPAIMGESDFQTAYQLWEVKTKRSQGFKGNWATRRGTEAEPRIRSLYELYIDDDFPPMLAQHAQYPFMRASLDGLNSLKKGIAEFKYPSKEKHAMAIAGEIPKTYVAQVQHQLFVTGVEWCDYVSYNGESIAVVRVVPDLTIIKKNFLRCEKFWNENVLGDTAPEFANEDFVIVQEPGFVTLFEELKKCKCEVEIAERRMKIVKAAIDEKLQTSRVICSGVRRALVERKGAIEYAKVKELQGVNLESYRKPSTKHFDYRIIKAPAEQTETQKTQP